MRIAPVAIGVVGLCALLAADARADPKADVTKAFVAFARSVATDKPQLAGVEAFLTPGDDWRIENDDHLPPPVPGDLSELRGLLDKPAPKVTHVVLAPGGKSAWLVAEIPTKDKKVTLRASALLALGHGAWQVRATHWSAPRANEVAATGCGMSRVQDVGPKGVPKELQVPVHAVLDAIDGDFAKVLSDSKDASLIGSAPKEAYSGGAAIKAVFEKWKVTPDGMAADMKELPAIAGTPDGELAWAMFVVMAPWQLCTEYRVMVVLANEPAGWKVVHQHYSEPN